MRCRKFNHRRGGFTLLELLVATGIATVLGAAVMTTWAALATTAVNTTAYADRHNEQLRVLDYMKRDLRRASAVEIYSGGVPVVGNAWGSELRVTLPDCYADALEEDDSSGARITASPALNGSDVVYGGTTEVRYLANSGAVVRSGTGSSRRIAAPNGQFTVSFQRESTGEVRCRIFYDQPLRGAGQMRALRRQVETVCRPRVNLQP